MSMAAVEYGYQLLKQSPKVKRRLGELGLSLGSIEFLGAGGNGKAYAIDDGSVAIKITSDPREARASNIIAGKDLKYVNKIHAVFKKAGKSKTGDTLVVYFIIQDRLYELDESVYENIEDITDFIYHRGPHEYGDVDWEGIIRNKTINPLADTEYDYYFWNQYQSYYKRNTIPKEFIKKYLQFMVDAHKELKANGVSNFRDFHEGNVMVDKGGNFKVIDLGYSQAPNKDIQALQEMRLLKEYTSGEFAFGFELEGFLRGPTDFEGDIDEDLYRDVARRVSAKVKQEYLEENVSENEWFEAYDKYVAENDIDTDGYFTLSSGYDEDDLRDHLEDHSIESIFFSLTRNIQGKEIIDLDDIFLGYDDLDKLEEGLKNNKIVIKAPVSTFRLTYGNNNGFFVADVSNTYHLGSFGEAIMATEEECDYIASEEFNWRESDFAELVKDVLGEKILEENEEYIERETRTRIVNDPDLYGSVLSGGDFVKDHPAKNPEVQRLADDLSVLFDDDDVVKDTISIKDDVSLEPDNEGFDQRFEINSQVLNFKPSVLSKLGNWLYDIQDEYDFYVNSTCGFHTHVSWPNVNPIDMLWVILGFADDSETLQNVITAKSQYGEDLEFFDSYYATLKVIKGVSSVLDSALNSGATEEDTILRVAGYIDTKKYALFNIHSQNTFEWRGPRGFIKPSGIHDIVQYLKSLHQFIGSINKFLMKDEIAGITKRKFYDTVWDDQIETGEVDISQKPSSKDRQWGEKKNTLQKYLNALVQIPTQAHGSTDQNGIYGMSQNQRAKLENAYNKLKTFDGKLGLDNVSAFNLRLLNNDDIDNYFKAEWITEKMAYIDMFGIHTLVLEVFEEADLSDPEYDGFIDKLIEFVDHIGGFINAYEVISIGRRLSEFGRAEKLANLIRTYLGGGANEVRKKRFRGQILNFIDDGEIKNDPRIKDALSNTKSKPILKPLPPKSEEEEKLQESDSGVTLDDLNTFYEKHIDEFSDVEEDIIYELTVAIDDNDNEVFQELRGDAADIIKEYADENWEFDLRMILIPDILEGM